MTMPYGPWCPGEELNGPCKTFPHLASPPLRGFLGSHGIATDWDMQKVIFDGIAADYQSDDASANMPYGPWCPGEELDGQCNTFAHLASPPLTGSKCAHGIEIH